MWHGRQRGQWTFGQLWAAVRDIASFAAGLRWGEIIISNPSPADPWEVALVAALLSVPFAARADELRRRVLGGSTKSENGSNGRSDATSSPS